MIEAKNENKNLKNFHDYKNQNDRLLTKVKTLEKEKIALNAKLDKVNINLSKSIIQQNSQGNKDFIQNLGDFMKIKDSEIKDLKKNVKELIKQNEDLKKQNEDLKKQNKELIQKINQKNSDREITVFINSNDQKVNCQIKCKENELFSEVEKKLYEKYGEYRETNNSFRIGDRQILKDKTIKENNIKDKDKIKFVKN